jgi:hypothetical protein
MEKPGRFARIQSKMTSIGYVSSGKGTTKNRYTFASLCVAGSAPRSPRMYASDDKDERSGWLKRVQDMHTHMASLERHHIR